MNPLYKGIYTQLPKTKSMNKEFQWTESAAWQFVGYYTSRINQGEPDLDKIMVEFKRRIISQASHSVSEKGESKRDWEVLQVIDPNRGILNVGSGTPFNYTKGEPIHSVKRLSDNTTWTVGEKVLNAGSIMKIKRFEVDTFWDMGIGIYFEEEESCCLWLLEKAPEVKEPLFITEDKVQMYPGGRCFEVHKETLKLTPWSCLPENLSNIKWEMSDHKYFSTRELAENYCLLNRPCLSINDVQSVYSKGRDFVGTDFLIKGLKELAQSKIKGGE